MRTPALTYTPSPRTARVRPGRRRSSAIAVSSIVSARLQLMMMARFISRAVAAVNERGLCAADVARLAELPASEIRSMSQRCGCQACWRARAN